MKSFRLGQSLAGDKSNGGVPFKIRIPARFDAWLQEHYPELVDANIVIDRKSRANPNGAFGVVARMIQLAYRCGALTQLARRKASLNAREVRLRPKASRPFAKKVSHVSISRQEEIEQERQEIRIEESHLRD